MHKCARLRMILGLAYDRDGFERRAACKVKHRAGEPRRHAGRARKEGEKQTLARRRTTARDVRESSK